MNVLVIHSQVSTCHSQVSLYIILYISTTTFVNQKIKTSGRHTQDKGDTVLFVENLCSGNKIAKRRKFAHELTK